MELDDYLNIVSTKRDERIRIIKRIIKDLGFTDREHKNFMSKEDFEKIKDKILLENELFTNHKYTMPLFGMTKRKITTIKSFMGFMNSLLEGYGFKIYAKYDSATINGVTVNTSNYYCHIDFIFDKFIHQESNPFNKFKQNILLWFTF